MDNQANTNQSQEQEKTPNLPSAETPPQGGTPPQYPYGYTPWIKEKKPYAVERGDLLFTALCAGLGFLFIRFIFTAGTDLAAGAFALIFTGALALWFRINGVKLRASLLFWMGILMVSAFYFALYGDSPLKILIILLNVAVSVWVVADASDSRVEAKIGRYAVLDGAEALIVTPFAHMGTPFGVLAGAVKKRAYNKNMLFALLGIAMAIPVLIVVGGVLSSADPIFESVWNQIFDNFWAELFIIIGQCILSIPVTLYFYGMFYGNRHHRTRAKRTPGEAEKTAQSMHCLPHALVLGIVIPILFLYFCFFITQTGYFLSAFGGYLPQKFSASDYARRGFFELCGVAGFNLALWALLRVFSKGSGGKSARVVCLCLSAVSLGMMAIALRKMILYIQSFGLTPLRVYTTAFMIFIGVMFIVAAIRCLVPLFPLERTVVAAGLVLLLGLAFSNPGRWIARYNVWAYETGGLERLDVGALYELGAPAVPELVGIVKNEDMIWECRRDAACYLWNYKRVNEEENWKTRNVEELAALRIMEENQEVINQHLPEESVLNERFDWLR